MLPADFDLSQGDSLLFTFGSSFESSCRGSLLAVYCFPTSALLVSRSISFRWMFVFLIFVSPYARCTVKSDIFGNDSLKQIERHNVGSAPVKKSPSRLKIIQVFSLSDSIHDAPPRLRG